MLENSKVTLIFNEDACALNSQLLEGYFENQDNKNVEKSHFFNDRYENIYLNKTHIPALETLELLALEHASEILSIPLEQLQTTYWFNVMNKGDVTGMHTHDDDDELLSAVYYVEVSDGSAAFLYKEDRVEKSIQAKSGLFVFFSPDLPHAVEEHKIDKIRLSIAFNFGKV